MSRRGSKIPNLNELNSYFCQYSRVPALLWKFVTGLFAFFFNMFRIIFWTTDLLSYSLFPVINSNCMP